jgi:hypothetical protein
MMNKIWKTLFSGLLSICLLVVSSIHNQAFAQPAQTKYLIVPDYVGQKVTIQTLSDVPQTFSIRVSDCNPNSVAHNDSKLYVACNKGGGNAERIEVYDFVALAQLKPQDVTVSSTQTLVSNEFNDIIAIQFDPEENLWVSSLENNQIIRFSKAALSSNNPTPDKKLIHSPDSPVGLAFDEQNGSLWVSGLFAGGIVINIPRTELNKPGNMVNGIEEIDATPSFCISNSAPGCPQIAGLFDNPEGITILNTDIWVSNNGGNHPAASLIRLRPNQGQPERFGNGVAAPFSCPGGLTSGFDNLYINDQSFSLVNTTCGENDRQAQSGKVIIYSASALTDPANLNLNPEGFQNITSRPGFGGIDVFSSDISFE